MDDNQTSPGRSAKMILGTLGIFMVFGFLALILSGFAGNESAEDRAYKGEFSEETTKTRWANLEEIETAQTEAFDQAKVDAALKQIGSTTAKPAKTDIVVPGSPTFLKQAAQQPTPDSEAAAPSAEGDAPKPAANAKEKPKAAAPVIKPAAPGAAAPEKETPKPGPVNAPNGDAPAKPTAKGDAPAKTAPKSDAPAKPAPKAEAPAKPAPKGDAPAKSAPKAEAPAPAPADQ